ncbi:TetR/AcrR family transcriptional regulator [Novosphingobium huizhouense]|uniref:TetR/AcrR family transcriptional regulator n=1 Tax=Novosphingobium huizhouense TaxID=2866625 RepID=UPI001CD8F286|nr:TetR/AcrR family transcriptional regulator [Novosphingobium huizhouense]
MTSSTRPRARKATAPAEFTVETMSRTPQQGRSKASLERMLAAARDLMIERSSEDFTLIEVSKRGNVSIGSIYLRFESKENLVRAVLAESMQALENDEAAMLARLAASSGDLASFVPKFVEAYAAILSEHAALLRLSMIRAEHDPQVAIPGKAAALRSATRSVEAMLAYPELAGEDREVRANSAYAVIFATLARQLSLGSTRESVNNQDWTTLKRELGRMSLAYLQAS